MTNRDGKSLTEPAGTEGRGLSRITPDRAVALALGVEGLLYLSERCQCFPFYDRKGLAVVAALSVLLAISLALVAWRRFQFSLRALFVVTVIVATMSAWLNARFAEARIRRHATSLATGLRYDVQCDLNGALDFGDIDPVDHPGWMERLFGWDFFHRIRWMSLDLSDVGTVDTILGELAKIGDPEVLEVTYDTEDSDHWHDVPDPIVRAIGKLSGTRIALFHNARLPDALLGQLNACPCLEELRLVDCRNVDAALAAFQSSSIERLVIHRCEIRDETLSGLGRSPRLAPLELFGDTLTDRAFDYLKEIPLLEKLALAEKRITGRGLGKLADLPRLSDLEVGCRYMSDLEEQLEFKVSELPRLQHLRRLVLHEELNSDTEVCCVAELKELRELAFGVDPNCERALASLASLTKLRYLDLAYGTMADAILEHICSFADIEELDLRHSKVTDMGLRHVAQLKHLRYLDLSDTDVTDAGIVKLTRLTRLHILDLTNTRVTNACLKLLEGLDRLDTITVGGTHVDHKKVNRLPAVAHALRAGKNRSGR